MSDEANPPVVFLRGSRIYFRPLELGDADRCRRWINDPDTRRFLLNVRPINDLAERSFIEKMSESKDGVHFAIDLAENRRHIGMAGLHSIDPVARCAPFGICIGEPEFRGKGIGTEATKLMLKYCFETLNLHRVELEVYSFNTAGIRAYEKAGFTREGMMRDRHFAEGRYWDVFRYGILSSEYFTQPAAAE